MRSRIIWRREIDPASGRERLVFEGRIDLEELEDLRLDSLDRMVLAEPVQSAADFLQSAEIVFRRLAQRAASEREQHGAA